MPDENQYGNAGRPMGRTTIPSLLEDVERRRAWGLPSATASPGAYIVELNLRHIAGIRGAEAAFETLQARVVGDHLRRARAISSTYYSCQLTVSEVRALAMEERQLTASDRSIYRIWPDFPVSPMLDRSAITIKSDAALRAFDASGRDIVWAVVDSGIDASHEHFQMHSTLTHASVAGLHRDFTVDAKPGSALTDAFGHGTHVAGIIAGGLPHGRAFTCYEHMADTGAELGGAYDATRVRDGAGATDIRGVAPECRLVSLKILDGRGQGRASDVLRAIEYIRTVLNAHPKVMRVHGLNLSLGYEFDAEMFACGQSPLCVEVDRLVKSGVVVVAAAGNTGYGRLPAQERYTKAGIANTINDPGNAALAITVGATHRESPHMYGVSYFSSKGPTADGRQKPDLVAPGERITSCATGAMLDGVRHEASAVPAYIDFTGTSMAAPHVSGAIAAFLSIRREYIQRPEDVKRVFLESATSLGRERYFQGHGLLDLMRAIQSV